ncbi:MAG: peptidylprolyl isomerase, partial [Erythrobacter sp.]
TPEITEALTAEKRAAAIADRVSDIESQVDGGTALADLAKEYGLTVETTPALLADGSVYGQAGAKIVPQLAPVLQTAFQMEESEPQLAEVVQGKDYVIFEVARVDEAAAPPLAEVRDLAVAAWKRAQGAALAKQAADRILAKVRAGTPLDAAIAAENKPGFQRERIDLERRQLLAQQRNRVPPPLVLMFSMAEGTAKTLEGPSNLGWYVVSLEDISTLPVDKEPGLVAQTRQQLGQALTEEYANQAAAAMRKELGVTRNDAAIAAVRKQLVGEQ